MSEARRQVRRLTGSPVWQFCCDLSPALVALALPWSTSATLIFLVLWVLTVVPTIEAPAFLQTLRRPGAFTPLLFVAFTAVGTVWAQGPWSDAFHGMGPAAKLLVIPLLFHHYRTSSKGGLVFACFLASCTLLLLYSWLIFAAPGLRLAAAHGFDTTGVPVRNAIDQNQEFALCAFALAALAIERYRRGAGGAALGLGAWAAAFLANIFFVALARTSLAYIVPLALLLAFRHLDRRKALLAVAALVAAMAVVWASSGYLRGRIEHIATEYREYQETNRPTSTGQRLAYWRESLSWIRQAPLIGHGTGSAKRLFEAAAEGKSGAWADKISNPHNQTLYVAIQWGLLGCVLLYLMWFFHARLFLGSGLIAWIGLAIVVQNVLSSLLNSHLFDFTEGWLYVLGVGVAGGLCWQEGRAASVRPES